VQGLHNEKLYGPSTGKSLDKQDGILLDELELRQDVQEAVVRIWSKISSENLNKISDMDAYKQEFLKLL
jgi:enoyl-[acyl-carrier protein] reductase/trans-2-enoyl-CoA reductase (NAD+)